MPCPTKTILDSQRLEELTRRRKAFIEETLRAASPGKAHYFRFEAGNPLPYMG